MLVGGLGGRGCLLGWTRRGGIAFDVVGVPGEVALETVLHMCGRGEAVVLAGVDDEFGGDAADAFEGLRVGVVMLVTLLKGEIFS